MTAALLDGSDDELLRQAQARLDQARKRYAQQHPAPASAGGLLGAGAGAGRSRAAEQLPASLLGQLERPRRCAGFGALLGRCQHVVQGPYLCDDCAARAAPPDPLREVLEASLASVPEHYRWAAFGDPLLAQRVAGGDRICSEALASLEAGRWLMVFGPPQSGKTSLAAACLRRVVDLARLPSADRRARTRGVRARFAEASALGRARREWGRQPGEAPLVQAAKQASLLVIDDLGREEAAAVCSEILHERHSRELQTITTTNLRPSELDRYDLAIRKRLLSGDNFQLTKGEPR